MIHPFRSAVGALLLSVASTQAEVTMLIPGFTVQELPVKISNINNLRFAPTAPSPRSVTMAAFHLLRDTNGDGLEDSDTLFWDKSSLSVPVGMVGPPTVSTFPHTEKFPSCATPMATAKGTTNNHRQRLARDRCRLRRRGRDFRDH